MAEWSNVPDSKSGVPKGTGGSNPSLSAIYDLVIDGEFVSDWKRSWSLPIRGSRDYLDYDLSIIEDLDCAHATYRWPVVFNLGRAPSFCGNGGTLRHF